MRWIIKNHFLNRMCLCAFFFVSNRENSKTDFKLILVFNRDEFYARPTEPLRDWSDSYQGWYQSLNAQIKKSETDLIYKSLIFVSLSLNCKMSIIWYFEKMKDRPLLVEKIENQAEKGGVGWPCPKTGNWRRWQTTWHQKLSVM